MDAGWLTVLLFAVGIALLVAEIFLPSHALLTIAGLGFLIFAIMRVFRDYGEGAGLLSVLGSLIVIPALAAVSIKFWHRTPLGRRISPPNPVARKGETFFNEEALPGLVGRFGRSLTPLRPIGSCEFAGRRVECVTELEMIEAEQVVEATGVRGRTLVVRPKLPEGSGPA